MIDNINVANVCINKKYLEGKEDLDIISVFGKENLEEIQKIVSNVTGLAFVTVDYKGEPVTETTGFTKFCKKMRKDKLRQGLCKLSDASGAIIAATSRQSSIYFCPCGLLEVAIPIVVNDKYLGGFVGGQVRCYDAPSYVMKLSKNMSYMGKEMEEIDINSPEFEEELKDSRIYTYNEFLSISKLVEFMINQLTKKEIISEHNKVKNLNKIKNLQEKLTDLEYKYRALKIDYNNVIRNTNLFFSRNMWNMISNLSIIEGAKKTNDAIIKYSSFISDELSDNKEKSIRYALSRVKSFIDINKIRYGDKINCSITCDDYLLDKKLPFTMVLPFIQSSIYFNMTMSENNLSIDIKVELTDEKDVKISIIDDGHNMSISELEEKYKFYGDNHEGIDILKSVKSVIKANIKLFGEEYKIVIEKNNDIGTTIIIKYPLNFEEGINYD